MTRAAGNPARATAVPWSDLAQAGLRRVFSADRPLVWIAPLLALLIVFTIYPLLYNIWLSFHGYAPFKRRLEYVGWSNWSTLVEDTRF